MTPESLIELAKRKNAALKLLISARRSVRFPAGHNKMTEADRNIDMEARVADKREEYDNLADEYAIRMLFSGSKEL